MILYRLCKAKHRDDLSGRGAEKAGGRWNSKGIAMLYTSSSIALCITEIAVHIPLGIIPSDYWLVTISTPDSIDVFELNTPSLPIDWKSLPHPHSTQVTGDKFIADGKYLVMKVPSAVVQGEFNYLINPSHKSFGKVKNIKKELFEFDLRLFIR